MNSVKPNSGNGAESSSQLLLRPREAARQLAVSERTLWGLRDLPRIRVGKRGIRYSVQDLRRWIESQRSQVN